MDSGIYAIIAPELNIIYVGQSAHMAARWAQHRYVLSQPHGVRRANTFLRRAWQKHGPEKFDFIVLENCPPDQLTQREAYWLSRARERRCYRVANFAGPADNPMRGQKHRPETIEKLRAASSSFARTEAHKLAISAAMNGRRLSKESIEKIRASKTGRRVPKLSGDKNYSRSPEHRSRMTGDGNPAKRAEVRAKLAAAFSMPVVDTMTGQSWASQSSCALELGVSVQAVNQHLRGKSRTCAGRVLRIDGHGAEVAA